MKLITNKSKNLLYRIVDGGNTTVQFSTSYAVATQTAADTDTDPNLKYKCQYRKGTTYIGPVFSSSIPKPEKIIKTFTTPENLDYDNIVFGVNGKSIDTLVSFPIKLKPSTTYTFTCNFTNITQGSISWKDMMLVEGSEAGEYEPYSYNLLDKWKFVSSFTDNGNIYTNDGEGSWYIDSLNGTANSYTGIMSLNAIPVTAGHKLLLRGTYPFEDTQDLNGGYFYCTGQNSYEFNQNTDITTIPDGVTSLTPRIFVNIAHAKVDNKHYVPQLYDLTLMYGEGNEPTTVSQFYQDHPELKVSPLGFIGLKNLEISNKNIKRLRYATTTRNLLDPIKFKSSSGTVSVDGDKISIIVDSSDTADTFAFFCTVSVKKNTNYTLSTQDCSYDIYSCYVYTDKIFGNRLTYGVYPLKFNSGDNESLVIGFYSLYSRRQKGVETWIQRPQLEEGSTATSYVPYGYLDLGIIPSNSGYILNEYNNLTEELLEENVEKDNINYHIPDKTNILLNKVEGKTNKIVQLVNKTVFITSDTKVGLTFTSNRNTGAITVNGTATASSYWNPSGGLSLINNHKYLICGNYAGSGITVLGLLNQSDRVEDYGHGGIGTVITSTENPLNSWGIVWDSGTTFNNVTIYPQLFDFTAMYGYGKEPTTVEQFKKDYPQFFDEKLDGIWNVKTSGISTTGKNLFIYDTIAKYDYNKDYQKYNSDNVIFFKAGTYSITTTNVGSSVYCQAFSEPNIAIASIFDVISYDSSLSNYMYKAWSGYALNIQFKQSKVLQFTLSKDCYLTFCADPNVVTNPMIELGTIGTTYEPYQENKIDLLSTQTLNGINGVNDYIEVIDKGNGLYDLKKIQNIDSVDLGTLTWDIDGSNFYSSSINSVIKPATDNAAPANCVCDKYTNCSINKSFVNGDFAVNTTGYIYFRNSAYTTADAFKTAVTGTILYYQLRTPVTTTIATNLTYSQVSALRTNGGLLLVNDNANQKYVQPNVTIKENYAYIN